MFSFDKFVYGILKMANHSCTVMVLPAILVILLADAAMAASPKKLTYEQAYKTCRTILSREATPIASNERYARYYLCMSKFGYIL